MVRITFPSKGLPHCSSIPYDLWGKVDYDSNGDCDFETPNEWSFLYARNRVDKTKWFKIKVSDDKQSVTIEGDDESVNRLKEILSDNGVN